MNILNAETVCKEIFQDVSDLPDGGVDLIGFDTGYRQLNDHTLGFAPGFIILMGRPSMGKTTLSLNISENIASKIPTLYFSIEMTAKAVMRKMISARTGISYRNLRLGKLDANDWDGFVSGIADAMKSRIHFVEESVTVNKIRDYCMHFRKTHKQFFVVIDYLQLIQAEGQSFSRDREVAHMSNTLKFLSKELNIPIMILSQMNRDCESRSDPRPKMSDLRDSGSLEQDADIIMGIYRPEMMRNEAEYEGQTYVDLLKNREGETGVFEMVFEAHRQRFVERSDMY
jgi:replicative DNA helicase